MGEHGYRPAGRAKRGLALRRRAREATPQASFRAAQTLAGNAALSQVLEPHDDEARFRRTPPGAANLPGLRLRELGLEIAIPVFLTVVLMPFTFSISVGIGAGFVSHVIIKAARGQARAIHPLLWIVAAAFLIYFAIDPIEGLLGVS